MDNVKERINQLEQERDQYREQAVAELNRRLGQYEGQLAILYELLEEPAPSKNGKEKVKSESI